jgi:EAL domain-containing protein (putative c-di-GMP-specific phosphodiesterase class I)
MGDIHAAAEHRAVDTAALKARLRDAMDAERFVLHYQPKVDLASGTLCGLEALMRWQDPLSGLVAPEVFIPMLEDSDLIVEVGTWAIRHALSQRLAWHIAGLRPPRIAVNVSPVQIRQPDFVGTICESLDSVGVGAPGLELELSESFFLDEVEGHSGTLCAIGDRGVNFTMDDCGTGDACSEQLAQLPVTEMKVDRPYVAGMAADAGDLATVNRIISLAHSLNMTVVAEGVETQEQRDLLRSLGCDRIQGYIASRPLAAAEVARMLGAAQQENS